MRIYFTPISVPGKFGDILSGSTVLFLCRDGAVKPFMRHVRISVNPDINVNRLFDFCGEFVDGCSFLDLRDGDMLAYVASSSRAYNRIFYSFYLDMHATKETLFPFAGGTDALGLAAGMDRAGQRQQQGVLC